MGDDEGLPDGEAPELALGLGLMAGLALGDSAADGLAVGFTDGETATDGVTAGDGDFVPDGLAVIQEHRVKSRVPTIINAKILFFMLLQPPDNGFPQ